MRRGRKIKLRLVWTCSDFVHHEHRWSFTAWLCGRIQCAFAWLRAKTEGVAW